MENKDPFVTNHVERTDLGKDAYENLINGIENYWGPYYRAYPHLFVLDYFQIKIHPFQQFLIYEIDKAEQSSIIATRGLGKSWILAVYACTRAVLYPGSKILVAAKRKKQAKLLITSKIMDDIYKKSEALRREIKSLQNNNNECRVEFWNGSIIEAVVSNDDARGYRANMLIIDEYRLLDQDTVDKVLIPFLNTPRQPGYLSKPEYADLIEENAEIYLSSGGYSSEWAYQRLKETFEGMVKGENMFSCSIPFTTALEHGLTTKNRIRKEIKKESTSAAGFNMEYCGLFHKEFDGALFKSTMLNPCRTLENVFYPPSKQDYIKYRNVQDKPYKMPKLKDELRIIACDIAISGGASNDNSIYMCFRLIPNEYGLYDRQVCCIESYNGKEQESQAIRIKELFEDFDADYMIIDTNGPGAGVWSYIQKRNYDADRGKEYDAYTCFNEDNTVDKELARIGIPVVYSMKAYAQDNHEMIMSLINVFMTQSIELPINSIEAKDVIYDKKNIKIDELRKKMKVEGELLAPFEQTDLLIMEMINLEHEIRDGKYKLITKGKARKDRASAILYGNFLCDYLEKENYKKLNRKQSGFIFFN